MVRVSEMPLDYLYRDIGCFPASFDPQGNLNFHEHIQQTEDNKCFVGGWGTTEEGSQSDVFKSVNGKTCPF